MGAKSARTKLYDAVERENVEEVKMILEKFPDLLNTPFFEDGVFNAATRASWRGDLNMIKMLKEKGADLETGRILNLLNFQQMKDTLLLCGSQKGTI